MRFSTRRLLLATAYVAIIFGAWRSGYIFGVAAATYKGFKVVDGQMTVDPGATVTIGAGGPCLVERFTISARPIESDRVDVAAQTIAEYEIGGIRIEDPVSLIPFSGVGAPKPAAVAPQAD